MKTNNITLNAQQEQAFKLVKDSNFSFGISTPEIRAILMHPPTFYFILVFVYV